MTDIASLIQTLGFPVALSVMLLFFGYRVYQGQAATIKEKDAHNKEFSDRLLNSQERINTTLENVKDLLDTTCKYNKQQ